MLKTSSLLAVLAIAALLVPPTWAQTNNRDIADPEVAAAYVFALARDTATALKADRDPAARRQNFARLFEDAFNTTYLAYYALGDHRGRLTAEQVELYDDLFEDHMVSRYAGLLEPHADDRISILASAPAAQRDAVVTMALESPGAKPILTEWRVRIFDGSPKVIDIAVGGVSLASTQRDEFDAIIRREGIDGFFNRLRASSAEAGG